MRKHLISAAILLATLASTTVPLMAQSAGSLAAPAGTVRTGLLLRQLDRTARVLMIGAHPDDEDTSLLAAVARGEGAKTAYLALTRGEGGQNLIGTELGEGLGIVRTGELLAARDRDGAGQFFTRAFDYGYSKTAEEALELWPRDELLADVVWVVRTFRPHVIVSVFSGTPRDGHGQHQAAGIMAHEAFEQAGSPDAFPEQLSGGIEPWTPSKLYRLSWFNPDEADLEVATGVLDPLLGRSAHQIAMESRSQHRSQEMGAAQNLGPAASQLIEVASRVAGGGLGGGTRATSSSIFGGLDTSLTGLAHEAPEGIRAAVREALQSARALVSEAREAHARSDADRTSRALVAAADALSTAQDLAGLSAPLRADLQERVALAHEAALSAAGVVVDVRTSDDIIVPGQEFRVDFEVWNGGAAALADVRPELLLPNGAEARATEPPVQRRRFFGPAPPTPPENTRPWLETAIGEPREVAAGSLERWSFEVRWPESAAPTVQYYLEQDRVGAFYTWPEDRSLWALPRNPATLPAVVRAALMGSAVATTVAVEYRGVDRAVGEFREPLLVAPRLSVAADPGTMVWPRARTEARSVTVTVASYDPGSASGTVRLDLPSGWTAEPARRDFELLGEGQTQSVTFTVFPDRSPAPGRNRFAAVATDERGREYRRRVATVDYEHILRTLQFFPAATEVSVFDVAVADNLAVGYVMGSGDAVPEAIRELGIEPEMLDATDLESGDLSRFDVIVLGVRAYTTRPDLVRNNHRVLAFARAGGTLIVQYNQYEFPAGGYAPWPVTINRPHDRVSVEDAPVTMLDPGAPVLNAPNRITPADFEGWVQERGLYFLGEWDDALQPVLEMADPGEEPKRGSLLIAPLGDGLYVYTGLSFFRQLPAGVPGAYRLFANLLSLRSQPVS